MGILIEMPRQTRKAATAPVSGGATIVFFTGVRYERHDEAPARETVKPRPASARARRRRA